MEKNGSEFREKVEALMAQVPAGKVTTYGDLAALAGGCCPGRCAFAPLDAGT